MKQNNEKKKVLLHYVMPEKLGGPNISISRIKNNEYLKEKFEFYKLKQDETSKGKINISLILKLRRKIKAVNPDIINICGLGSAGFHCMIAAILAKQKNRVLSIRGYAWQDNTISNTKKAIFKYIIEPITLVLATKVHGISDYTLNLKLTKLLCKKKSICIYNFAPEYGEEYEQKNPESDLRKLLNISNSDIVICSASRLVYDKGYKYLIRAIKNLDQRNIKYIIIGEGEYKKIIEKELEKEIKNGIVIMLNRVFNIYPYLRISNIFVLPSLHENLGNVFIEASAAGLPVVATNIGGIKEVIQNHVSGILVPIKNVSELTKAIEELINNEKLRKYYGENGKKIIKERFNKEILAEKYYNLYS